MPTRNVRLTDRHAKLLGELVETGRYQNASKVMREGLRLVEEREAQFEAVRERIAGSLDQADCGEYAKGSVEDVAAGAFAEARKRPTP